MFVCDRVDLARQRRLRRFREIAARMEFLAEARKGERPGAQRAHHMHVGIERGGAAQHAVLNLGFAGEQENPAPPACGSGGFPCARMGAKAVDKRHRCPDLKRSTGWRCNRHAGRRGMSYSRRRVFGYWLGFWFGWQPGFPAAIWLPEAMAPPAMWSPPAIAIVPAGHVVAAGHRPARHMVRPPPPSRRRPCGPGRTCSPGSADPPCGSSCRRRRRAASPFARRRRRRRR